MSYISLISKVRNNFLLSNASPPPTTTDSNEFLALFISIRTSFSINLSKFLISDPPPVKIIPLSNISADNSGGHFPKTSFKATTISLTESFIAS